MACHPKPVASAIRSSLTDDPLLAALLRAEIVTEYYYPLSLATI